MIELNEKLKLVVYADGIKQTKSFLGESKEV